MSRMQKPCTGSAIAKPSSAAGLCHEIPIWRTAGLVRLENFLGIGLIQVLQAMLRFSKSYAQREDIARA